jgi:UDP-N-acetylglucosamine--N-acetylmuramyl-(pentapeptide) pyrophosphoryl-undecaprenol N-acetylglucosamine transferase
LVAEGSGGHLVPALQVAQTLAKTGARIKVWYAQRQRTARLANALTQEAMDAPIDVDPIPIDASNPLRRLWHCGQLWHRAQRCFDTFSPDVVVGFGGWISAPVVLAAKQRRIGCVLHEQNVVMGRANQWLARWVDRVAVSFHETQAMLHSTPSVLTGLPVRQRIGQPSRAEGAEQFGFNPNQPTLLILGGSQGARTINRLMTQVIARLSSQERQTWQVLHLVGPSGEAAVEEAYAAHHVTSWITSFLVEMEAAYAQADVVISRAGASTIAELARCGKPAILIPYPYAGGHQRANAQLVEAIGGGLMIEESEATPERVLGATRRILADQRLQIMMGAQMRSLNFPDATERLSDAIVEVARLQGERSAQPVPAVLKTRASFKASVCSGLRARGRGLAAPTLPAQGGPEPTARLRSG